MSTQITPATIQNTHLSGDAREWLARLALEVVKKQKSVLTKSAYFGPLRVQRPFYPESDGTCHIYILHPPGGLVIGDKLTLNADIQTQANALLTTPSAGKVYGAKGLDFEQHQSIHMQVSDGGCLEWLPQETIIFNGANAVLNSRFDITGEAKLFTWDIVRLGRIASGEQFESGSCKQSIEIWKDETPYFIEKNTILAGSDYQQSTWGMRSANNTGTLVATLNTSRDQIDEWLEYLTSLSQQDKYTRDGRENLWGLTQKDDLFIARFLGDSITLCREGFQYLWQQARPLFNSKNAVIPRIWNT